MSDAVARLCYEAEQTPSQCDWDQLPSWAKERWRRVAAVAQIEAYIDLLNNLNTDDVEMVRIMLKDRIADKRVMYVANGGKVNGGKQ